MLYVCSLFKPCDDHGCELWLSGLHLDLGCWMCIPGNTGIACVMIGYWLLAAPNGSWHVECPAVEACHRSLRISQHIWSLYMYVIDRLLHINGQNFQNLMIWPRIDFFRKKEYISSSKWKDFGLYNEACGPLLITSQPSWVNHVLPMEN
jgi:hypothetical protein